VHPHALVIAALPVTGERPTPAAGDRFTSQFITEKYGPMRLVFRNWESLVKETVAVVALPGRIGDMKKARLSKAEARILEQYWKLGTCSVREILESLPEDERVAYTTVQTLVYRLEQKGALRKVKKIGNAQLFAPAIDQSEYRSGLVRDLLDLFGGSPRSLVSNLLENGRLTLKDLRTLQNAAPTSKNSRGRGGKGNA
jgi:BlaI family transcriptional regulator, penicillinase repressor